MLTNSAGGSFTNGMRFFLNSWNTNDGRIMFETGNGTLGDSAISATGEAALSEEEVATHELVSS